MVSVGGGCEAAVSARTRCGWFKVGVCCELLYGRRFPLNPYVRPAILYDREGWMPD